MSVLGGPELGSKPTLVTSYGSEWVAERPSEECQLFKVTARKNNFGPIYFQEFPLIALPAGANLN